MFLKEIIRNFIAKLFAIVLIYSGSLKRKMEFLKDNDLVLSIYGHNPDKILFEKTIEWLIENKFRFITFDEFLQFKEGKLKIKKAVWLSFDDGWKDNRINVLPILSKYNIEATFFVSTNLMIEGYFWLTELRKSKYKRKYKTEGYKKLLEVDRKRLFESLDLPKKKESDSKFFSKEDLLIVSQKHTIGNHTHNHVICVNCNEMELAQELIESSNVFLSLLGYSPKIFAYPNGDYNQNTIKILKTQGFNFAFTTKPGFVSQRDSNFEICRAGMMDGGSLEENLCHIFGVWQPIIKKIKEYASSFYK
jgi:poly-beta-1,6-N-acetyl-D-glucosamine N-deacetylase